MRLRHRHAHLLAWCVLGILLPAILVGAVALRLSAPPAEAPVRLATP
jgi:hypothetical protein